LLRLNCVCQRLLDPGNWNKLINESPN
jgi:hypothetical protein